MSKERESTLRAFSTNLTEYPEIEFIQDIEINVGDVVSINKRDVSGYTFNVLFKIKSIQEGHIDLEVLMPLFAKTL